MRKTPWIWESANTINAAIGRLHLHPNNELFLKKFSYDLLCRILCLVHEQYTFVESEQSCALLEKLTIERLSFEKFALISPGEGIEFPICITENAASGSIWPYFFSLKTVMCML